MSLDAFIRCPTPGCEMRVLKGQYLIRYPCRDHGGDPTRPQFMDRDPWGDDINQGGPAVPPPPVPAALIDLGRVED